jgi:hypothetical protein
MTRNAKKFTRMLPVWLLSVLAVFGSWSSASADESCTPANPRFQSPAFGLQTQIAAAMQVSVHIRTVNKPVWEPGKALRTTLTVPIPM